MKRFFSDKSAL